MNPPSLTQPINVWPFVNGSYAAAILFLVGMAWLTYRRYRRAQIRLAQAEQL